MDGRLADFVVDGIEGSSAQAVVIQLDVPAVVTGDVDELLTLLADPPLPVAVWVGPDPARVRGAGVGILAAAPIRGAAPGVTIGPAAPFIAGDAETVDAFADLFEDAPRSVIDDVLEVDAPIPGLVEIVEPSIGQFVVGLDGLELTIGDRSVVLSTATTGVEAGIEVIKPGAPVTFIEPGVIDQVLRVAVRPDAAYFFLVLGLALAAFEFFAAGPGLAAAAAALILLLAGYGIGVLPVSWPAVAATIAGLGLYTADFQRNDLGWRSLLGTIGLGWGGFAFIDGSGQLSTSWWVVLMVVVGMALFFGLAMTSLVRARFSTRTIGREHLVGLEGVAASAIAPDGEVELNGARWRARALRASGIEAGDSVRVVAVEGINLEVEPLE